LTSPMERLKNKITKEVLWLYILRLLKDRPMYAYEIKGEIERAFGFSPATVSAYVVLYKLEKDGYVEAFWKEGETGKPARKYYKITENGEKLLKEGLDFLYDIIEKLKE